MRSARWMASAQRARNSSGLAQSVRAFSEVYFDGFGFALFVNFLLRGEGGIAVEGWIRGGARGRAGVVKDVEQELAVVVVHVRAASDDLLEFDH